jgi:hypothetical protein
VAAGLLWRVVRFALVFPMWGDEAFLAVNFLLRGFGTIAGRLEHDMVAPLGFLWAELAAARVLGAGEASLRLLPFLAGVAAFLLFARLAFGRLSRRAALVGVAVLAASYYPVRHAAEVKPYAFDLLAAAVLVPLAWRVLDDPARPRAWAAFSAASAVLVWFSYPAAFTASGALLVLGGRALLRREGGGARAAALAGVATAVVAASFAAMYAVVARHQQWSAETVEASGQWAEHVPPLSEPWRLPLWLVRELTGNLFAYPNGGRAYGAAATTLLVACGAVSLWRRGRGGAVLLLLSPLVPMFVAAALRKYPFGGSARTALHLAVPICLLAGQGVAAATARVLGARRGRSAALALSVLLALAAVGGAVADVVRPYKKESDRAHRDAFAWVEARSRPGDAWVVFGSFSGAEGVPDLRPWGGSAAILRWHALSRARGPVSFGAPPGGVARAPGAAVWVLAYADDEHPFPEALWAPFLAATRERLGAPDLEREFVLGADSLRALRFAPP